MRLIQAEVANRLRVRQDTISRTEQRADMLLSTRQSYVEAIGGRLALVAELANRPPVRIKGFSMLLDQREELGEPDRPTHAKSHAVDFDHSFSNEESSP